MNTVIVMLLAFVALGLAADHLGKKTYLIMGALIVAYMTYAYIMG